MKIKSLFFGLSFFLLFPNLVAAQVSTQIVITFNALGAIQSSQPVPLSPWLYGLMSILLAGIAYSFMRKQATSGLFVFLLTALFSVFLSFQPKISEAIMAPTSLSSSPTTHPTGELNCGPNSFTFSNAVPNGLVITSVSLNNAPDFLEIDPSSTCVVNTRLTGTQQCTVVINEQCG